MRGTLEFATLTPTTLAMLNEIKHSLQNLKPTPLSDQRFDESHEWFEGQSNQQSQILSWLQEFGQVQIARRATKPSLIAKPFRVLSVGCGSGILDLPLITTLAQPATDRREMIQYVGIDPNPIACGRFRDEFRKLGIDSTELIVLEETVETYRQEHLVDLTHVVHSMYYFADPAASLQSLIQNVAEDGELVIFQAPKGELNRLADCFWQGHVDDPIWFSADLEKHLEERGVAFTRSSLHAEVDVTDCFDPNCPKGRLTFDFIVQSDCGELSHPIRESVLDHLRSISRIEGEKILAPHPVDVFVIHHSSDSSVK